MGENPRGHSQFRPPRLKCCHLLLLWDLLSLLNCLTYPEPVEKGRAGGHPVMGRVKEYCRSLVGVSPGKMVERRQGVV